MGGLVDDASLERLLLLPKVEIILRRLLNDVGRPRDAGDPDDPKFSSEFIIGRGN